MLMINIFVLIIALAVLIFGANKFVDASSNYAAYFGVNEFFIGLTIVALGTSIPELFVAVSAIFNRVETVAIGTIVCSNIANISKRKIYYLPFIRWGRYDFLITS